MPTTLCAQIKSGQKGFVQTAGKSNSNQIPSKIQFIGMTARNVFIMCPSCGISARLSHFRLGHIVDPSDQFLTLAETNQVQGPLFSTSSVCYGTFLHLQLVSGTLVCDVTDSLNSSLAVDTETRLLNAN